MDTVTQPKLSIITINLNNASGLCKTIESVVNQTFTDYEYLIIDGGSTDNSVGIIKDYADKLTYWVSEPDKGIYRAMNKGILLAKGDYCLFLNSGDWLLNENIIEKVFSLDYNDDLICCKVFNHKSYGTGSIQLPKDKLTFYDFYAATLAHQSTFIKTRLLIDNGLYDEKLTIVADWKFFMEVVIIQRCSYITLDIETTYFSNGGISSAFGNVTNKERELVLNKYFSPYIDDYKLLHSYKSSRVIRLWEKLKDNILVLSIYKFFVH